MIAYGKAYRYISGYKLHSSFSPSHLLSSALAVLSLRLYFLHFVQQVDRSKDDCRHSFPAAGLIRISIPGRPALRVRPGLAMAVCLLSDSRLAVS